MNKIDVISLLIAQQYKLEVSFTQSIPLIPKTLVMKNSVLTYIKSSASQLISRRIFLKEVEEVLLDLIQKSEAFPVCLIKTKESKEICMSYHEALNLIQGHIIRGSEFKVQEYIKSNGSSAQIIRVFISGLNMYAKVLENTSNFDSGLPDSEKYLLGDYKISEKMILSSSISKLKNKAKTLSYLISAASKKDLIINNTELDFICSNDNFYFISAKCSKSISSLSVSPKSLSGSAPASMLTLQSKSRVLTSSKTHRELLRKPEEYLIQEKLEARVNGLIGKSQATKIKHVSYKQWSAAEKHDLIYGLYSKRVASYKESVKKSHSKGIGTLKGMINDLGAVVKKFQLEYNLPEYVKKEAGKFLLEKMHMSSNHKKFKLQLTIKPETIPNTGKQMVDYCSRQIDVMNSKVAKCKKV